MAFTSNPGLRLWIMWMLGIGLALMVLGWLIGPRTPRTSALVVFELIVVTVQLVPLERARRREAAAKRSARAGSQASAGKPPRGAG
jgi:hypothetical protein